MTIERIMHEVRALRENVNSFSSEAERRAAFLILSKVMAILWHARFEEFRDIDTQLRKLLKGGADVPH